MDVDLELLTAVSSKDIEGIKKIFRPQPSPAAIMSAAEYIGLHNLEELRLTLLQGCLSQQTAFYQAYLTGLIKGGHYKALENIPKAFWRDNIWAPALRWMGEYTGPDLLNLFLQVITQTGMRVQIAYGMIKANRADLLSLVVSKTCSEHERMLLNNLANEANPETKMKLTALLAAE